MEQENLILISQKCSSCGASLDIESSLTKIKCMYCGSTFQVIRPLKVSSSANSSLSEENKQKYINIAKILEKSMLANNFQEAYDYCNKLLEMDTDNADVWIDKAICAYWLSSDNKIIFSQAKEITTYLNTARQINQDSEKLKEISIAIAENLFVLSRYYLYKIQKTESTKYETFCSGYLRTDLTNILEHIKLWDTAYQIHPNVVFLKRAVEELTPVLKAKVNWEQRILDETNVFPVKALKEAYIQKIKKAEPLYIPPKKPSWFAYLINYVSSSNG
ncbi:MAG: tetratricopeptide repeat protein [Bacteroidia bacterium]|nr:tetratricopeptide repeat protein [Bacteroidia bacterium]